LALSAESTTDGEQVGSEIDLGWGALEVEEQERGPVKYLHRTSHHARLAHAVVARTPVLHVPHALLHISPPSQGSISCMCFFSGEPARFVLVPYPKKSQQIGFQTPVTPEIRGFGFPRHWCASGRADGECGITSSPGLAPVAGVAVIAGVQYCSVFSGRVRCGGGGSDAPGCETLSYAPRSAEQHRELPRNRLPFAAGCCGLVGVRPCAGQRPRSGRGCSIRLAG
jgi:hypothetical protein